MAPHNTTIAVDSTAKISRRVNHKDRDHPELVVEREAKKQKTIHGYGDPLPGLNLITAPINTTFTQLSARSELNKSDLTIRNKEQTSSTDSVSQELDIGDSRVGEAVRLASSSSVNCESTATKQEIDWTVIASILQSVSPQGDAIRAPLFKPEVAIVEVSSALPGIDSINLCAASQTATPKTDCLEKRLEKEQLSIAEIEDLLIDIRAILFSVSVGNDDFSILNGRVEILISNGEWAIDEEFELRDENEQLEIVKQFKAKLIDEAVLLDPSFDVYSYSENEDEVDDEVADDSEDEDFEEEDGEEEPEEEEEEESQEQKERKYWIAWFKVQEEKRLEEERVYGPFVSYTPEEEKKMFHDEVMTEGYLKDEGVCGLDEKYDYLKDVTYFAVGLYDNVDKDEDYAGVGIYNKD